MNRWLFLLLAMLMPAYAISPLPTTTENKEAVPLIIQPFFVRDIYRSQILDSLPFHVTVLTLRNFDNDRWRESKSYAIQNTLTRVGNSRPTIMIGEAQENVVGKFIGIFRDKDCHCYLLGGKVIADDKPLSKAFQILETKHLYILTDGSDLAESREKAMRGSVKNLNLEITVGMVGTASALRAKLIEWNSKPRGILFINAFDLYADSGNRIRYRYIEEVVTSFNKTHLEVGIYRNQHRSALAIGLDPKDIGRTIVSTVRGTQAPDVRVKSSVNVARLGQLNLLSIAAGSFKEAFLYEPIDSR